MRGGGRGPGTRHGDRGGVVAAVGAGQGGVGGRGQGGGAVAGGGAGDDGDTQRVIVPTPRSATAASASSLGLLEDVFRIVHGDYAGVRNKVWHSPVILEIIFCK